MIFIDTGAFIARYVERDQHHKKAQASWNKISGQKRIVTSNFVLDETLTYLGRTTTYAFASEVGKSLCASERLEILRPDSEIEFEALQLFGKYANKGVSFTDCTSFALMKRARIANAFTFDRHFRDAGFRIWS